MKGHLLDTTPLHLLSRVSVNQLAKLARMGLKTIQDLLLHLPIRYEDRSHLYQISDLLPGMFVTITGKIIGSKISYGRRSILTIQLSDNSGIITLRFFNFNTSMKISLSDGKQIIVYGEVKQGKYGIEIIHPEYRAYNKNIGIILNNRLIPIYSSIEGMHQATLRKIINQALNLLINANIPELLPDEYNNTDFSLPEAIYILHNPPANIEQTTLDKWQHPAQYRLILEELLAYNLNMLAIRSITRNYRAHSLLLSRQSNYTLKKRFLTALPFKLTCAQQRVVVEIEQDLAQDFPMMRLIQGDVGSGKTLVAALAALYAITYGKQVALMAPTELLAEQHTETFRQWFEPLGLSISCLTGKKKDKARLTQQEAIAKGQISMVIGTHAIFQEQIHFFGLALVIIDEQHRFGVHQRLALWKKGKTQSFYPHQLIMTATPIPRTLAMTAYANLDASIIDELPPGRSPVTTVVIPNTRRGDIIQRIKYMCLKEGRQAYWICTLIEKSEALGAQAAQETYIELQATLVDVSIGLIHGRMKAQKKQVIMKAFKQGFLQLLVATTVIEVGVDVPNASLIIIDNSERLGLAQLHQLRGRVGRGNIASHCVLLYKIPLNKIAQKRLQVLRNSNNGFVVAQKDLEIRGPGELFGTRQTGSTKFKVADLLRDQALLPIVQNLASNMHLRYPKQSKALIQRWLPERECYTNV
ncbi:ATP-dependent DNA helicase RecG [Candidatus Fukatsuia anoeciicola]|uniref:ATP-dependent DNA helicase RecG n=1 Tax=Candidatus Fukatsuia anoeciicola TaxID=2994492 RepID=UPI00346456FA